MVAGGFKVSTFAQSLFEIGCHLYPGLQFGTYCVHQVGLELVALLPPKCCGYRHGPPQLASLLVKMCLLKKLSLGLIVLPCPTFLF